MTKSKQHGHGSGSVIGKFLQALADRGVVVEHDQSQTHLSFGGRQASIHRGHSSVTVRWGAGRVITPQTTEGIIPIVEHALGFEPVQALSKARL